MVAVNNNNNNNDNNNSNNNNNNIREQFIYLMERVCCITYFPESVSSIPSQQKNV